MKIHRSTLSPLNKVNKFYFNAGAIRLPSHKDIVIFGDNDLDFTLGLVNARKTATVTVTEQNALYSSFWGLIKSVGSKEFVEYFLSELPFLYMMSHKELLETMLNSDDVRATLSFFLLVLSSRDGSPFSSLKPISKEKIFMHLNNLSKIEKLLTRINFIEGVKDPGIHICLSEINRTFDNRDFDTLCQKLELAPQDGKSIILSNLQFDGARPREDLNRNIYYSNA